MNKYRYTQHTPGHVAVPALGADGKAKIVQPDPELVKKAIAANALREKIINQAKAAKAAWKPGMKPIKVGIPGAARVPVAAPEMRDVMMTFGGVYELPADLEHVEHLVSLGYLEEVKAPPAKAEDKAPAGPLPEKK